MSTQKPTPIAAIYKINKNKFLLFLFFIPFLFFIFIHYLFKFYDPHNSTLRLDQSIMRMALN